MLGIDNLIFISILTNKLQSSCARKRAGSASASFTSRRTEVQSWKAKSWPGRAWPLAWGIGKEFGQKRAQAGNSRSLPFPKVTSHGALPLRTERHVPDSIATLRIELAAGLAAKLERCTCCAQALAPRKLAA